MPKRNRFFAWRCSLSWNTTWLSLYENMKQHWKHPKSDRAPISLSDILVQSWKEELVEKTTLVVWWIISSSSHKANSYQFDWYRVAAKWMSYFLRSLPTETIDTDRQVIGLKLANNTPAALINACKLPFLPRWDFCIQNYNQIKVELSLTCLMIFFISVNLCHKSFSIKNLRRSKNIPHNSYSVFLLFCLHICI